MKTILQVLKLSESYLEEHGVQSARLGAELLLASVLGVERLELYLSFDRPLVESELAAYRKLISRRANHEPIQYILGHTGFRELIFALGPGVLVPRPETEGLVQLVLDRLGIVAQNTAAENRRVLRVLDLCTGSGVVGISLAHEREGLWCLLTDISLEALHWAVKNSRRLERAKGPDQVDFLCGDLAEPLAGKPFFDVVVGNPPYVRPENLESLPEEIKRYEPAQAYSGGGSDGTAVIGRIIESVSRIMAQGALLALEIGESQDQAVNTLFAEQRGKYSGVEFHRDLVGKVRFVTAFRS
ncbi:MAG TPA: peptide chain release factor N(5)-glutamine methyltransferase [archaeon]|nr:peptide chain release factor N(5)-glutamine methyltransferase [archaeon]